MNPVARFQVIEVPHGFAVKDTRDGTVWSRTYRAVGWAAWAARAAARLNEAHGNRRYF